MGNADERKPRSLRGQKELDCRGSGKAKRQRVLHSDGQIPIAALYAIFKVKNRSFKEWKQRQNSLTLGAASPFPC